MAYKRKRITNPVNGQTIEFITTSNESQGQQLEMLSTWEQNSTAPAAHYHPLQDEVFRVIEGELTLRLNGHILQLQKGESIHIPAGTVHAMWNQSGSPVIAHWKVFPAYDTEYFLETGMGLAADGKTGKNGMPDVLQVALLGRKYQREFRLDKPPYILQQAVFLLLIPFALLVGRRALYPKYID